LAEITFEEQARLTYVQGMIMAAAIEMQGMVAENAQRASLNQPVAYTNKDFVYLIGAYGLGHNALLNSIHGT
jgi:ABC-type uncharacterized transport system ATPase component